MEKWERWSVTDAGGAVMKWALLFQHWDDSDHAVIRVMKANQEPFAAVHVTGQLLFTRWCKSASAPGCINDDVHSFSSIRPFCCDRRLFPDRKILNWSLGGSQPWPPDLLLEQRSIYLTTGAGWLCLYILFAWAERQWHICSLWDICLLWIE